MARFHTDSIAVTYSNLEPAKMWWIGTFDGQVMSVPDVWDNQLPSDVALKFSKDQEPSIFLGTRSEVEQAGYDRTPPVVSVVYCDRSRKHEKLSGRGMLVGPIPDGGDTQFFEIVIPKATCLKSAKSPNASKTSTKLIHSLVKLESTGDS